MQANRWPVIRWDFTALRSHFGDTVVRIIPFAVPLKTALPPVYTQGFICTFAVILHLCLTLYCLHLILADNLILMYSFKLIFSVVLFVFFPIPLPTYEIVPRSVPLSLTDIYTCLFVCLMKS